MSWVRAEHKLRRMLIRRMRPSDDAICWSVSAGWLHQLWMVRSTSGRSIGSQLGGHIGSRLLTACFTRRSSSRSIRKRCVLAMSSRLALGFSHRPDCSIHRACGESISEVTRIHSSIPAPGSHGMFGHVKTPQYMKFAMLRAGWSCLSPIREMSTALSFLIGRALPRATMPFTLRSARLWRLRELRSLVVAACLLRHSGTSRLLGGCAGVSPRLNLCHQACDGQSLAVPVRRRVAADESGILSRRSVGTADGGR